jgi:hypothetical protein
MSSADATTTTSDLALEQNQLEAGETFSMDPDQTLRR